jgi:uncharacterized GH25 family protein
MMSISYSPREATMSGTANPRASGARRGRRIATITAALLIVSAVGAAAHDMFVQPARFFAAENADVMIRVLNGTFSKSENSIDRGRLADVSIVSPSGRQHVDTAVWSAAGDTSTFTMRTGAAGTYVVGVSTRPNLIALEAKDFNQYLAEDGIPDVLAARSRSGELDRPARERYSKHVKALIQVGASRSDHFSSELGYPAEIVPLENPYVLQPGRLLRVRTLVDGRPTANQYVLTGGRTPSGARIAQRSTRSDADGIARIPLRSRGTWYVKFINMRKLDGDTAADYESKWATLTFQVR